MNSTLPIFCGTMLTGMVAAGLSHYWSVQTVVSMAPHAQDTVLVQPVLPTIYKPTQKVPQALATAVESPVVNPKSLSQEQFFNELLTELKHLKSENQDLRELMGETNRDVMKLAFRVDTHSESFRPLPTSEERNDTSFHISDDALPGVLPPRATPVERLGE